MEDKYKHMIKRTMEHIHAVQKNAVVLVTEYSDELGLSLEGATDLMFQALVHDTSKFDQMQFGPYADFTWAKKNGQDLTEAQQDAFDNAVQHHYIDEYHHPESMDAGFFQDRADWIECACDLQAMSQEFGEDSARGYFEDTWIPKSKDLFEDKGLFDEVCEVIRKCIDCFEDFYKVKA